MPHVRFCPGALGNGRPYRDYLSIGKLLGTRSPCLDQTRQDHPTAVAQRKMGIRLRLRSLSHLIRIIGELKAKGAAFRSLTEQMDTTTPHGEFLFNVFGSLAQYERALIKERVMAGLAAARRRGRKGDRPPALDQERIEQIIAALDGGASKASVCRTFKVPRSTLIDTLNRAGWTGTGESTQKSERPTPQKVA